MREDAEGKGGGRAQLYYKCYVLMPGQSHEQLEVVNPWGPHSITTPFQILYSKRHPFLKNTTVDSRYLEVEGTL